MGLQDKIKAIEEEIDRTQKNKHTEYHLGILKAKIVFLCLKNRQNYEVK